MAEIAVGTERIEKRFKELKKAGRAGLITFITAGDPNIKISTQILQKLPGSGADIIELGMPFSDPMADGAAIQASSLRSLSKLRARWGLIPIEPTFAHTGV